MKSSRILMLVAAVAFLAAPAFAQGRGNGRPAGAGRPATAGKPANPGAQRGDHGKSADHAGKGKEARGTSGKADDGDKGVGRDANSGKGNAAADRDFAARLAANPQQKARIEAMLPTGMTLQQAADGFRNQGQFIAAVEASKNQNIPFASLKTEMTGPNQLSLGQAIEKLKPAPTTTTTPPTTPAK